MMTNPSFLYTTQSIYIAALQFLEIEIRSVVNLISILTMDHELVLKNSSSAPVYTLQKNITYLKVAECWLSD